MCPTTFAVERGTFDLPPDRAGDVPRRHNRDRPKRWEFQPRASRRLFGVGYVGRWTIEGLGRKWSAFTHLGYLPKSSAASVAALSASVAAKMRLRSLSACS